MNKKIFIVVMINFIVSNIALAQNNYSSGQFKVSFGNPNTGQSKVPLAYSTIQLSGGYEFSSKSEYSTIKASPNLVQNSEPVDFMEISEFVPQVSGFDSDAMAVLFTSIESKPENNTKNCSITYEVGSNDDRAYSKKIPAVFTEIYSSNLSKIKSPKSNKKLIDTHSNFKLNRTDAHNQSNGEELKTPYYIKSVTVSCSQRIITGFSPRLYSYNDKKNSAKKPDLNSPTGQSR